MTERIGLDVSKFGNRFQYFEIWKSVPMFQNLEID